MRGENYFKRLIAALLNRKQPLPEVRADIQTLCDEILCQSSERQAEALERLSALFDAKKTALRQEMTEAFHKRTEQHLEAVLRKVTADPLQSKLQQGGCESIPVVFICDDAYAIPTAVAILSLLINKKEGTRYAVTVLGRALHEKNAELFSVFGSTVTVLACEGARHKRYAKSHPYVSDAALLKFDIPQLLPQHDKVLYLDSDILVEGDLSSLYETKLDESYAAVAKDLLAAHYQFDLRTGVMSYFNSGVLLLNTKRMREDEITARLVDNKANDPWRMLMDQDTFNVTFTENVVWLHPRYNLMYANNFESGWSMANMADFYGISEEEMRQTMERPVIQHLSSRKKPWNSLTAEKYLDYQTYRILLDLLLEQQGIFHPTRA